MCHQMICEKDDDQSRPLEMHQMTSHARGDLRPPEMHQMTSHARRDLRPSEMHQMTSHAHGGLRPLEMHQMTSHAQIRRSPDLHKDLARVRPICAQIRRCAWVSGNVLFRFPLTWWGVGTPALVFFSDCCLDMNFQ
ncbi:hypothetical protein Fot_03264 [Forsythia ovata]|uniref:Uncharacterized protein n=1 Tax=Forsythia ovata TaxID=205694 RepID=A0ABD1X971_9LAMI